MSRWLVVLGTAVVAGCLFPSFDDFQGSEKKGKASSGGTSSSGETTTSSSSSSSSSSGSSGQTTDGGPDPNAPGVQCGNIKCPAEQGCCTTAGGPTCETPAELQTCGIQFGDSFLCDGNEDCKSGQVCCVQGGDAACADTCAGKTLCNALNSTCPAGQSCTGKVSLFKACQ